MMAQPLALKVDQWPTIDRERWAHAQVPAGFLEAPKPASHWSAARRRMVEYAYGQWLSFLLRNGVLDASCPPGKRASRERLKQFIDELKSRVAPASTAAIAGALLRMFHVIEPDQDWSTLADVYRHLKLTAVPSRDKFARIVPAADLFTLGIHLMDTCDQFRGSERYRATRYRDGLLIALLISCPIRLKNLAMIQIGHHLLFTGGSYRLAFSTEETKTGTPYLSDVPAQFTEYVDRYLKEHRRALQLIAQDGVSPASASGFLWLNRFGLPMSSAAIWCQTKLRTKAAFGKGIWPHLFRDCAVTELVDMAPQDIGMAPDLLGHRDFATTKKHYLQACGVLAHTRVQEMIVERRRRARQHPRPQ